MSNSSSDNGFQIICKKLCWLVEAYGQKLSRYLIHIFMLLFGILEYVDTHSVTIIY